MNSDADTLAGGLPHSEIPGSTIARISPGLFAACHVLHRLSVPRHPPDALTLRLSATPNGKDHSDIGKPISQITTNRCDKLSLLRRHFVTGAHLPPAQHVPIGRTPRPLTVSRYGHTYSLLYDDQSAACSGGQMAHRKQFQTLRRVIRSASRRLRCKRLSALPQPDTHRGESDAFTGSGGDRDRTDDPLLAKQVLSQLSYTPGVAKQRRPAGASKMHRQEASLQPSGSRRLRCKRLSPRRFPLEAPVVGQGGFEPPTSRLSSARSNQLSY